MSENIYYENKFYRDDPVDWSTHVDVIIASSVRDDIKNMAKRQMCMVIAGRRSSVARNVLCAFAILTKNNCSLNPSLKRRVNALIFSHTDFMSLR